jgi:hypothetical protein
MYKRREHAKSERESKSEFCLWYQTKQPKKKIKRFGWDDFAEVGKGKQKFSRIPR